MDAPASYHGHDVLHFLLEAKNALSTEEILNQVTEKFGANASFHTCSAEGMDGPTLIAFLMKRGKIVPQDDGFVVAGHRICNH